LTVRDWNLQPANDLHLAEAERWSSLHRESGLVSSFLHLAAWGLIKTGAALWHRLRIIGREHIPAEPPFIMVANHCSHLDALLLGSAVPWHFRDRVFPVAAGDVFFDRSWKAAFSAKFLNALPIWRKRCGPHALKDLRQRLVNEPCAYILFPEGGRSRDGCLLPFKTGIGMLVANSNVPVVPCFLSGTFRAMPPGSWLPRPSRIELRVDSPLRFDDVPDERAGWEQIAQTLHDRVARLGERQYRADQPIAESPRSPR
jgi:1-acyl-sn-glycerol-3-phosphate acyltransferase